MRILLHQSIGEVGRNGLESKAKSSQTLVPFRNKVIRNCLKGSLDDTDII